MIDNGILTDNSNIISNDFLEKYKNKTVPWGFNGLGYIVYRRTYSRLKSNGENVKSPDEQEITEFLINEAIESNKD